jgi:hypothetical protein
VATPACQRMHTSCDALGLNEVLAPTRSESAAPWFPLLNRTPQFTGYTTPRVCSCAGEYLAVDRGDPATASTCQLRTTLCVADKFVVFTEVPPYHTCVDVLSCPSGQQPYRENGPFSNRVCGDIPLGYWSLLEFSSYGEPRLPPPLPPPRLAESHILLFTRHNHRLRDDYVHADGDNWSRELRRHGEHC